MINPCSNCKRSSCPTRCNQEEEFTEWYNKKKPKYTFDDKDYLVEIEDEESR